MMILNRADKNVIFPSDEHSYHYLTIIISVQPNFYTWKDGFDKRFWGLPCDFLL